MPRANESILLEWHGVLSTNLSGGLASLSVNPSDLSGISSRLNQVADAFTLYRVKKLKFRLHPNAGITVANAIGFVPGV